MIPRWGMSLTIVRGGGEGLEAILVFNRDIMRMPFF